jgi:hypothetical protein
MEKISFLHISMKFGGFRNAEFFQTMTAFRELDEIGKKWSQYIYSVALIFTKLSSR